MSGKVQPKVSVRSLSHVEALVQEYLAGVSGLIERDPQFVDIILRGIEGLSFTKFRGGLFTLLNVQPGVSDKETEGEGNGTTYCVEFSREGEMTLRRAAGLSFSPYEPIGVPFARFRDTRITELYEREVHGALHSG